IELGEIETILARCPGVAQAVVLGVDDAAGEAQLVAYLVRSSNSGSNSFSNSPTLEENALRALLREKLPAHMIPTHFIWLPAFPLTPNGKVDRRALPRPEAGQP